MGGSGRNRLVAIIEKRGERTRSLSTDLVVRRMERMWRRLWRLRSCWNGDSDEMVKVKTRVQFRTMERRSSVRDPGKACKTASVLESSLKRFSRVLDFFFFGEEGAGGVLWMPILSVFTL